MEECSLPKARPISCNVCPAFQRHHTSLFCAAESPNRFSALINTTFENSFIQMVLHRPSEPARLTRYQDKILQTTPRKFTASVEWLHSIPRKFCCSYSTTVACGRLPAMYPATTNTLIPSTRRALTKTACVAVALFILDAFVLNQGIVALCLIFVTVFVFLPRAVWVPRGDRHLYGRRLAKVGIYVVAAVAIFGSNALQNRMADRRAIKIGNACL